MTKHFLRKDQGTWRCGKCSSEYVMKRRRKLKRILAEEAGGCCANCGYDRCLDALDFHHRDDERKWFALSDTTYSLDRMRAEAAKCDLLCKNCHAELHAVDTGW